MGMGGSSSRDKLQSEINVTPLVDVCLVLLIIFMVVTPLLQNGVSVQIPQTDNPDKKPESSKQKMIVVQYASPPAYHMDQKQLSKAEFQQALDELYQRNPSAELVIKADQRLKYGDVKEVFKMTKEAGFQDVGLIAEKKSADWLAGSLAEALERQWKRLPAFPAQDDPVRSARQAGLLQGFLCQGFQKKIVGGSACLICAIHQLTARRGLRLVSKNELVPHRLKLGRNDPPRRSQRGACKPQM